MGGRLVGTCVVVMAVAGSGCDDGASEERDAGRGAEADAAPDADTDATVDPDGGDAGPTGCVTATGSGPAGTDTWPDGAESALLDLRPGAGTLFAVDRLGPGPPILPTDGPVDAIFFAIPLEQMQLAEGPVAIQRNGRPVPPAVSAFRGERAGA